MTALIELAGVGILLLWIVIPYREFRDIFRRLRNAPPPPPPLDSKATAPPPPPERVA